VGEWAYGYSYFILMFLNSFKKDNTLAVKLSNKEFASRWYPGAGLYRNVSLIIKKQSIDQWGQFITTLLSVQQLRNKCQD
jgi:beta-galactosidase